MHHLELRIALDLVFAGGQRHQLPPFQCQELLLPAVWHIGEPLLVVEMHLLSECLVQLCLGIEHGMPQRGVYLPVGMLHAGLRIRLVPGMCGTCRDHRAAVVVGKVLKHPVDSRLVAV